VSIKTCFADIDDLQSVRHTISGVKNHVLKRMRAEIAGDKSLVPSLTTAEKRWLKNYLPSNGKRMGFRTYTKSAEARSTLAELLADEAANQKAAARKAGQEYVPVDIFSTKERLKLRMWKELTSEEQEQWRVTSQENEMPDELSE